MKIVLFDLGRTLEDNDVLLPGARETLERIRALRDAAGRPACVVAIVSDSAMPADPSGIPAIRQEYDDLLTALGIRDLFEPLAERLTFSAEAGVRKPDRRIFRAAIDKIDPALGFEDAIFITESLDHVRAARRLGMRAVHFRGPGQTSGEVTLLTELVPVVASFLAPAPPAREGPAAESSARRLAVYDVPPGADADGAWPGAPTHVTWARFGNQALLIAGPGEAEEAARSAERAGLRLGRAGLELPRERLHLVVQNGRLFQHEHPEVPVVYDGGRFLAVDLDPARARELDAENETCFSVRRLEDNEVVFSERPAGAAREAVAPRVQSLVGTLSRARYEADLRRLAALPTRFSTSTHFLSAAEQARAQFELAGYDARLETINVPDFGPSRNVVAERPGEGAGPRGVVIVCAHLDSINLNQIPAGPAPGADDNASGSAGVLELARVFGAHRGAHDLRFILFGGEEEGLHGSKQYVAGLADAERARITAVVNMDMIATRNVNSAGAVVPPGVLLEGSPLSRAVVERLGAAAATYTRLRVQTSFSPANSDHVPFNDARIPAVLTIEAADTSNRNVHFPTDTVDRLDFDLALEILRMNVAFVAEAVGQAV